MQMRCFGSDGLSTEDVYNCVPSIILWFWFLLCTADHRGKPTNDQGPVVQSRDNSSNPNPGSSAKPRSRADVHHVQLLLEFSLLICGVYFTIKYWPTYSGSGSSSNWVMTLSITIGLLCGTKSIGDRSLCDGISGNLILCSSTFLSTAMNWNAENEDNEAVCQKYYRTSGTSFNYWTSACTW